MQNNGYWPFVSNLAGSFSKDENYYSPVITTCEYASNRTNRPALWHQLSVMRKLNARMLWYYARGLLPANDCLRYSIYAHQLQNMPNATQCCCPFSQQ